MRFDRRVTLFAILSVICFGLTPLADDKYDHVPPIVGGTYAVLALLFLADWLLRARAADRPWRDPED